MSAQKRNRRRKEARPAEIIEAGFTEFSEKGFLGTRLDDVAARAGIAKGTIYLYFENKEALFEAAVRARLGEFPDIIEKLIDYYPGSTKFLLKQVFKRMHKKLRDPDVQTILRVLIAEGDRFPSITEFYYREFISKMQANVGKIIARGVERGELRDGPATKKLPVIIVSPGIMAAIWQMTFSKHHPIGEKTFLDAHIDLVLNGIMLKRDE